MGPERSSNLSKVLGHVEENWHLLPGLRMPHPVPSRKAVSMGSQINFLVCGIDVPL